MLLNLAPAVILFSAITTSAATLDFGNNRIFSGEEQEDALAYWTEDRMRNAGQPHEDDGIGAPEDDEIGGPWDKGGGVTKIVGKIYYHNIPEDYDGSCTGTVVDGENLSTVITAGHCVYKVGQWLDKWIFVPGQFVNAIGGIEEPYGRWAADTLMSTPEWRYYHDKGDKVGAQPYDTGAVVLNQQGGKKVADVVGSSPIAFYVGEPPYTYAMGYPVDAHWEGNQELIYSSGEPVRVSGDGLFALRSIFTGGASGGPWFKDFDVESGNGTLYTTNTNAQFTYTFGPYFGQEAESLYNEAQAKHPSEPEKDL